MDKQQRIDTRNHTQKESLKYPKHFVEVPPSEWGLGAIAKNDDPRNRVIQVFRSRHFMVQVVDQVGHLRLTIQRTEFDVRSGRFKDGITWDEMQSIKNEIGYGEYCGLELFPPAHLVINVANLRHMFLMKRGEVPNYIWMDNLYSG